MPEPAQRSAKAAYRYGSAPTSICWSPASLAAATARLLAGGDPRTILQRLMDERHPTYAEADVVVDSMDGPHEQTVEAVLSAIGAHLESRRREPDSEPSAAGIEA